MGNIAILQKALATGLSKCSSNNRVVEGLYPLAIRLREEKGLLGKEVEVLRKEKVDMMKIY